LLWGVIYMAGRQTASQRAAAHQRAIRGGRFPELDVTVRGGKVYKGGGVLNVELGDLAGACAGIASVRKPLPFVGPQDRGTVFVACSNGAERRTRIMHYPVARTRQAVKEFNALADSASP
jgi:hypothetical protein